MTAIFGWFFSSIKIFSINPFQIMLTALQAQLELRDCGEVLNDYRAIAGHCLPPRYVPNIPHEAVAMHHQSLKGMTPAEAKKAFLNLIQSWPLHKATIFDVMVSCKRLQEILFRSDKVSYLTAILHIQLAKSSLAGCRSEWNSSVGASIAEYTLYL